MSKVQMPCHVIGLDPEEAAQREVSHVQKHFESGIYSRGNSFTVHRTAILLTAVIDLKTSVIGNKWDVNIDFILLCFGRFPSGPC